MEQFFLKQDTKTGERQKKQKQKNCEIIFLQILSEWTIILEKPVFVTTLFGLLLYIFSDKKEQELSLSRSISQWKRKIASVFGGDCYGTAIRLLSCWIFIGSVFFPLVLICHLFLLTAFSILVISFWQLILHPGN